MSVAHGAFDRGQLRARLTTSHAESFPKKSGHNREAASRNATAADAVDKKAAPARTSGIWLLWATLRNAAATSAATCSGIFGGTTIMRCAARNAAKAAT